MTKPILLTSAQAAARKGVTRRQIQRLAKAGLLPVAQRNERGALYFKASHVDRAPASLGPVVLFTKSN